MPDSFTNSPCNTHNLDNQITTHKTHENNPQFTIPVEIVSDQEMALIEAAFSLASAATRRTSPFSLLCSSSLSSPPIASTQQFSTSVVCDVEDLDQIKSPQKKKTKVSDSFFSRFRKKRGLSVTDLTSTFLRNNHLAMFESSSCRHSAGKTVYLTPLSMKDPLWSSVSRPERTYAMKAGSNRHAKLEEEVSKKVEVRIETLEDIWALKFINFIICANQLLFDGLTREMPVVGFVQGVWMVGVIDELRMPVTGNDRKLTLVDTKTRAQPRLPAEPQCRNGRLQLKCYKYLWDNLVSNNFPSEQFYEFFSMDPQHVLSDEVKMNAADSGFPAETLGEVERYFNNVCSVLPPADDQLLLRYELQEDNSLIGEDEFNYDGDWLKAQLHSCLEFWRGGREAKYVSVTESWKCRFCKFATVCPRTETEPSNSQSSIHNN